MSYEVKIKTEKDNIKTSKINNLNELKQLLEEYKNVKIEVELHKVKIKEK